MVTLYKTRCSGDFIAGLHSIIHQTNGIPFLLQDGGLTKCFELTVLAWIPIAFLVLFTPLDIQFRRLRRNVYKSKPIPWNKFSVSKAATTIILIFVWTFAFALSFILDAAPVFPTTAGLYTLAVSYTLYLMCKHRQFGVRTSGLLFLFWLLTFACGIPQLYREVQYLKTHPAPRPTTSHDVNEAILFIIHFALTTVLFLLNCFSDLDTTSEADKRSPQEEASFLRTIIFQWFDLIMWRGYKKPVEPEELHHLMPEDCTQNLSDAFDKHWNRNAHKKTGLLTPIRKAFGGPMKIAAFLQLAATLLKFASPKLLA